MSDGDTAGWNTDRWRSLCIVTAVVAIYLLPRLIGLDTFVTWDERQWLAQSANFYSALVHLDLDRTFQTAHPGITTMWTGTLAYFVTLPGIGPEYTTNALGAWLPGPDNQEIHDRIYALGGTPLEALVAARSVKVLLQGLMVAAALLLLGRHLGRSTVIAAGGLIALSPFIIAHDRIFAIDGLVIGTTLLAIAALAHAFVRGPTRLLPWALAGVTAALTMLTRLSSVAIAGVVVLLVLWSVLLEASTGASLCERSRRWIRPMMTWLSAAGVTALLLWPAWIVSPISTAKNVVNNLLSIGAFEGKHTGTFFLGTTSSDPGPMFYPAILAWRSTPLEWLGMLALIAIAVNGALARYTDAAARRVAGVLIAYLTVYLVGMTLSASKSDRYMAVVISVLCVLGALGLVRGLNALAERVSVAARAWVVPVGVATAVVVQGVFAASAQPYYLTYYNPLLGGIDRAVHQVPVGWGEGGSEAAEYLDEAAARQQEAPADLVVRGPWDAPWIVTYLLDERVQWIDDPIDTLAEWEQTDYLFVYIGDWQRQPNDPIDTWVKTFSPTDTVTLDGIEYLWIYDLRDIPAPDDFAGDVGHCSSSLLAQPGFEAGMVLCRRSVS